MYSDEVSYLKRCGENNKGSGKVVISYDPESNLVLSRICVYLPNYQLSIFCQILQILFGYMHPIVSGNLVSN